MKRRLSWLIVIVGVLVPCFCAGRALHVDAEAQMREHPDWACGTPAVMIVIGTVYLAAACSAVALILNLWSLSSTTKPSFWRWSEVVVIAVPLLLGLAVALFFP
jgi:hypothetical protein